MQSGGKRTDLVALLVAREDMAIIESIRDTHQTNITAIKATTASMSHNDAHVQPLTISNVTPTPAIKVRPLLHLLESSKRTTSGAVAQPTSRAAAPTAAIQQLQSRGEQISNIELNATKVVSPSMIIIVSDSESETSGETRAPEVCLASKVSVNVCTGDNGQPTSLKSGETKVKVEPNKIDFTSITQNERRMLRKKWKHFKKINGAPSQHEHSIWYLNEVQKLREYKSEPNQATTTVTLKQSGDSDSQNVGSLSKRGRHDVESKCETKIKIVDTNCPKMDAVQAMVVKRILFRARNEDSTKYLYFTDVYHHDGALYLTCIGDNPLKWMQEILPTLKPWETANLRAVPVDGKQPTFVKVKVFLPYDEITYDEVFERLAKQNPGLNTHRWKMIQTIKEKVGQTMIMDVDKKSVDVLEHLHFMAKIKETQIKFHMPKETKGLGNPVNFAGSRQSVESNLRKREIGEPLKVRSRDDGRSSDGRNTERDDKCKKYVARKETPKVSVTSKA